MTGAVVAAASRVAVGFPLGNLDYTNSYASYSLMVAWGEAANSSGILSRAWLRQYGGGTTHFVVGSLSSTNFTVRSVSTANALGMGINEVALSPGLAVVAGDVLGIYSAGGTPYPGGTFGFGGSFGRAAPGSLPTVGQVIALTSDISGMIYIGASS